MSKDNANTRSMSELVEDINNKYINKSNNSNENEQDVAHNTPTQVEIVDVPDPTRAQNAYEQQALDKIREQSKKVTLLETELKDVEKTIKHPDMALPAPAIGVCDMRLLDEINNHKATRLYWHLTSNCLVRTGKTHNISVNQIAEMLGVKPRYVDDLINKLVEKGLVEKPNKQYHRGHEVSYFLPLVKQRADAKRRKREILKELKELRDE